MTTETTAERAYEAVKTLVLTFKLLPDQKLNEVELAMRLAISRTPLREALYRLTAEGILKRVGRSFCVPGLNPVDVRNLFEARVEVEAAIVRLATSRATDEELADLEQFLKGSISESPEASIDRLVELDCGFHERLAVTARNSELYRILKNLNDRIHLIRWIAMEGRRDNTQSEHQAILKYLEARDAARAEASMRKHILHRNEEILTAIRQAYAHVHTKDFGEADELI